MKNKALFLSLIAFGTFHFCIAQEDLKEWKSKLKKLTPEEYKQLVEDNSKLQNQLSESQGEVDHLRSEGEAKDAEIVKLEKELEEAKNSVTSASEVASTPSAESSSVTGKSDAGIVYKVQIGAFKNKDLKKYLNNSKNFSGDVDADGTRKYTLGQFTEYWEADQFKKYLREMGVKDAWIVSYKDGKRVPIKDALEGVL